MKYIIFNKLSGEILNISPTIQIDELKNRITGDSFITDGLNWNSFQISSTETELTGNETNISQISGELTKVHKLTDVEWQAAKNPLLKQIENSYISFLTNIWTPKLRNAGLIAQDHTITVDNTDEVSNIIMLLQLQTINYDDYVLCSNEFLKFKTMIVQAGGIMSKVKYHEEQ